MLGLVGVACLASVTAGGIFAWKWMYERPGNVRGSTTVEWRPADAPRARRRPARILVEQPWTTYGYDRARTHFAPDFQVRPPFRRLWMLRTGYYIEFPPAVAYGRVYVAQLKGRFFAVDAKDGRVIWSKRFPLCTMASPTVGRGVVYQPFVPTPCDYGDRTAHGFIAAMNAQSGRVLWRFPVSSESSPLLMGRTLYFGAWDHKVYALDVRTRRVRWTFLADDELNSSPAYAAGTIFIGSNGGSLYAIDARTGRLEWRARSFSTVRWGREYFYATPTVAYGRVFASNSDGFVYAFGAASGRLLWATRTGTYVYSAPAVWRRTVYVGSYDGKLYALDAGTGDVRWTFAAPSAIHGAPTVLAGLVYFSTCGTCGHRNSRYAKQGRRGTFAVDARTGRLVWSFPDGRYSPVVADRERLYLTGDTRQYGLEPLAANGQGRPARAPAATR